MGSEMCIRDRSRAECEGARAGGCRPGGNIERELAYGNRSSADEHASEVWEKAVGVVKTRTAIVVPARLAGLVRGLRVNPVGLVEEKGKMRVIHDSTFSGNSEQKKGGAGQ